MTSKRELQDALKRQQEYSKILNEKLDSIYKEREGKESRLEVLLDDILTLEPQLKHHRRDSAPDGWAPLGSTEWDFERVHRAAEHIRNQEAAESVGYTDACTEPWPANVTPIHVHLTDTDPAA